jgi:uncharacterized transporter YbjL
MTSVVNTAKTYYHDIRKRLNAIQMFNNGGNMAVVAGVISIVAVVIVLIIGAVLAGAFTTVAGNSNLGLDAQWIQAVSDIGNTSITSFQIAGLLPIAIVAGLVIAVISVIMISRN